VIKNETTIAPNKNQDRNQNRNEDPNNEDHNQARSQDSDQPNLWLTYRTRFTIRARILSAPLSFVDALGREQNGRRGDYLVESNGMVTITPRQIFEDIYVAMGVESGEAGEAAASFSAPPPRKTAISTTKRPFFPPSRRRSV
jgi:hypothetical protein